MSDMLIAIYYVVVRWPIPPFFFFKQRQQCCTEVRGNAAAACDLPLRHSFVHLLFVSCVPTVSPQPVAVHLDLECTSHANPVHRPPVLDAVWCTRCIRSDQT